MKQNKYQIPRLLQDPHREIRLHVLLAAIALVVRDDFHLVQSHIVPQQVLDPWVLHPTGQTQGQITTVPVRLGDMATPLAFHGLLGLQPFVFFCRWNFG